jgi:hypothetical protein
MVWADIIDVTAKWTQTTGGWNDIIDNRFISSPLLSSPLLYSCLMAANESIFAARLAGT